MPQVVFTYFAFVLWMMSCVHISLAQTSNLEIDTIVTTAVESDHFKIRLPRVANIESYKILFRDYGVFDEYEVEGNMQQFVGDYNNIQRTKAINQKIRKQGIEPTLITFFMQPSIIINEVAISQEAITGELTNKSLSFSRRVMDNHSAEEKETALVEQRVNSKPKDDLVENNLETQTKKANAEKALQNAKKDEDVDQEKKPDTVLSKPFINRPGVKNKVANENIEKKLDTDKPSDTLEKNTEVEKLPFVDESLSKKLPETGEYVLLLPVVSNPQVYQIVLKDLGHVKYGELADGSLYFYFGYFDSEAAAQNFIPKLNERGFVKAIPIVQLNKVQQEAQFAFDQVKTPVVNEIQKEKKPSIKVVNTKGEYFRIELPKVSNPEIFFKAFEDIGNTHSEIAPNGDAIYYIGAFDSPQKALAQLEDLKPRGLTNGSIIRFSGDKRVNPYRRDQVNQKETLSKPLEESLAEKNEPLIKTNAKGKYVIRLGQVDNPEVFKEVFGDIGKIKVGYLEDETEYFYLGRYYVKEDAEFVVKQLKERGLTQLELVNVQADTAPVLTQKLVDKVNSLPSKIEKPESTVANKPNINSVNSPPIVETSKVEPTDIPMPVAQNGQVHYKILLGGLDNPKLYRNILKDFGSITQAVKDGVALYYLGNFSTLRVSQIVIEEIRTLGIETPLKVVEFKP